MTILLLVVIEQKASCGSCGMQQQGVGCGRAVAYLLKLHFKEITISDITLEGFKGQTAAFT